MMMISIFYLCKTHYNISYCVSDVLFHHTSQNIKICQSVSHLGLNLSCFSKLCSPSAQQNLDGSAPTAGGAAQRPTKDQSARRKDEAKQAAKKPKENALSQFDLNNYASK